ncbi:MAG: (d)CMP kinase [Promethearchaeota archaeon]
MFTTLTIAVSGEHGAGKTTVAMALAETFNLRYVSAGMIFRRLAEERNKTLAEFGRIAEQDPEIDRAIDDRTRHEAAQGKVVLDAYISGWVARDLADLKIYLHAPFELRVRRIAEREQRPYRDVLEETKAREESQKQRFLKFYGIDVGAIRLFDLVLNTALWDVTGVVTICVEAVHYLCNSSSTG